MSEKCNLKILVLEAISYYKTGIPLRKSSDVVHSVFFNVKSIDKMPMTYIIRKCKSDAGFKQAGYSSKEILEVLNELNQMNVITACYINSKGRATNRVQFYYV